MSLKIDGSRVPGGGSLTWELTMTVLDGDKKAIVITDNNRGPLLSLKGTLTSDESRQLYRNWTEHDDTQADPREDSALHFGIFRRDGTPNTALTAVIDRVDVAAVP